MSSSRASTKKTRTWREKNLVPAGFVKRSGNAAPLPSVAALFRLLQAPVYLSQSQSAQYIPQEEFIPPGMIAETSSLSTNDVADILRVSLLIRTKADEGSLELWNEAEWRRICYNPSLECMTSIFHGQVKLVTEEPLGVLNVKGVTLLSNTADYLFGFPIARQGRSVLSKSYLDAFMSRLQPYVNDNKSIAFPFAVLEAKQFGGSDLEAENQCGESVMKMLFKLRQLGGDAKGLPLLCTALVGPRTTLYLASTDLDENKNVEYQMQEVWQGNLSRLPDSIVFHVMLYRYFTWIVDVLRPTIIASLENFNLETDSSNQ